MAQKKKTTQTKTTKTTSKNASSDSSKMNLQDALKDRSKLVGLAIIVIVIALLVQFRSQFIVATVNGKPITRLELVKTLEEQAGKQALDGLVIQELIRQEAAEADITVEDKDVDAEIDALEAQLKEQGQELDAFLELQGLTRDDIRDQAELQILLEKLTADEVKVTEEEIDEAVKTQLELLADSEEEIDEKKLRKEVEEGLKAQRQSEAIQGWIEVAREKATVNFLREY